jgi:hypothetical protein
METSLISDHLPMAFFGILKHHGLATLPVERSVSRTEERGTPGATYASLEAFYEAGGHRRSLSIEHDFGVMWREGTRRRPRYRLSWIEATGELYTLALSEFDHQRKVELLGIVDSHEQVEQLLMGWETLAFGESTLDWVRERVTDA